MDVLVCPSCSRRYALNRSVDDGGWHCMKCGAGLEIEQSGVARFDLFDPGARIADGHLHPLGSPEDAPLGE